MINEKLIKIISEISVRKSVPIKESTQLVEELGYNSVGLLSLITEIEAQFEFRLKEEDFTYENFETPQAIASMLKRYEAAG